MQDNAGGSDLAPTTAATESVADRTLVTSVISPPSAALQAQRAAEALPPTILTVADLADAPLGTSITLETIALAEPGVTSKNILLVAGGEVYFNKASWPDITAGDRLRVTGTLNRTQDNLRLKITAATNIVVLNPGTLPHTVSWDDAEDGERVAIAGDYVSKKQMRVLVRVDGQEIPVILATNAGVTVPKNTATVQALGVKRYRSGELVLLVTSAADFTATPAAPATVAPQKEAISTTPPRSTPAAAPILGKRPLVGGGLVSGALALVGSFYAKARRAALPL